MGRPTASNREDEHRVAGVTFVPGTNDGPLDCSCGEGMLASQFIVHRKEVEAKHYGRALDAAQPTVWKRTSS